MMGNIFELIVKAVSAHVTKNSGKYIAGGAITVAGAGGYAIGKSVGHKDGKKEGTIEQAERDKKKMKDMNENHEKDRSRWKKEKNKYEDLLNNVEQKI